jgi:hypothetical protein
MVRKSLPWLAGTLLLAVVILACITLGGATMVQGELEERVATAISVQAAQRGWTVEWAGLTVEPEGIELTSLTGRGPENSWVTADQLRVDFDPVLVLFGERTPAKVTLTGVEGDLDVRALSARSDVLGRPQAETHGSLGGRPLPPLTVKAREVTVRGLPGLPAVTTRSIVFDGAPVGERWTGSFQGWCAAGCGDGQKVHGSVARDGGTVDATVDLERPVELAMSVPGTDETVAVTVQRVAVSTDGEGFRIGIGQVGVELPTLRGRTGQLHIDHVDAHFDSRGSLIARSPKRLALRGPRLTLLHSDEAPRDSASPDEPDAPGQVDNQRPLLVEGEFDLVEGPAVLAGLIGRALPHLERLEFEGGQLSLPEDGLELRDIRGGGSPDLFVADAAWQGGRVGFELRPERPQLTATFRELPLREVSARTPIGRALARFGPTLKTLDGRVSGSVAFALDVYDEFRSPVAAAPAKGRRSRSRAAAGLGELVQRRGVQVDGFLEVAHGVLDIHGLTPEPIRDAGAELVFMATVWPPQRERGWDVVLDDASLLLPSRSGGVAQFQVSGNIRQLEIDDKPVVDMRVFMEDTDCQTALTAIPRGMVPHLAGHIQAKGRFAPVIEFYVDLETPRTLRIDFDGLPGTCEITDLGPFSPDYLAGSFKQEVREGVTRQGINIGPDSGSWVHMSRIPRHVQAAMYLTEDTRFYRNNGFVPNLIRRALVLNLEKKRYAYGGSTISQQLVKNLFLTRNKTLSRKLEEALIVWRMESVLSKERILELYINCVEFGPNVYGIRRAARYYFGKHPSQLTKVEGLFIAALKPAPWQGEWFKRLGMSPDEGFWFRRMEKLMRRLLRAGVVTQQEFEDESPYVVFF